MSLEVTSALTFKHIIQTSSATGAAILTLGRWHTIYISFIYSNGYVGTSLATIDDVYISSPAIFYPSTYQSSIFTSSDKITIGAGFIGQLKRLQIYSPGVYQLDPGFYHSGSICSNSK